jgi:hypothetical protein
MVLITIWIGWIYNTHPILSACSFMSETTRIEEDCERLNTILPPLENYLSFWTSWQSVDLLVLQFQWNIHDIRTKPEAETFDAGSEAAIKHRRSERPTLHRLGSKKNARVQSHAKSARAVRSRHAKKHPCERRQKSNPRTPAAPLQNWATNQLSPQFFLLE